MRVRTILERVVRHSWTKKIGRETYGKPRGDCTERGSRRRIQKHRVRETTPRNAGGYQQQSVMPAQEYEEWQTYQYQARK